MTPDFPTRISFDEAAGIIDRVAASRRLSSERIPLQRGLGRVLAEDLVAPIALPNFDNSAMDGFAVRGLPMPDGGWQLVGEQFAGADQGLALAPGQGSRITTGAPLPAGAEAIVIKENARLDGDRLSTDHAPSANDHIRRAGEDVQPGTLLLSAGDVLTPARLGLAAALGLAELTVARRPTVAVFTTGDELKPPGQTLAPGEIHDSNRAMLQTLLLAEGLEPVAWPILPDDPARIASMLEDAAFSFDLVITCGGVSAGEKDHLPALLQARGETHFWKVRMKPGMPLLFGRLGEALLLGLPGNPVSVLATFLTLGRRLIDGLQGRNEPRTHWRAKLTDAVHKHHDRREFMRGRLQVDDSGQLLVVPDNATGSHRLAAAAGNDVLLVLPEGAGEFPAGTAVECLPCAAGRG
ncbi:gephyrin-like molybdotransferase Glp [uncultured Arenimonas sp.]|uniref:molybdopterin molybdotransferase MoeA n=1 Tax=uncultured Arenimonas sp. TaxID=546226 RepID=UPI0030DC7B8D